MPTDRDSRIEEVLAQKVETWEPTARATPACPTAMDLVAVATGEAGAEFVDQIKEHWKRCPSCREELAFYSNTPVEDEPPLAGSLLERLVQHLRKHSVDAAPGGNSQS